MAKYNGKEMSLEELTAEVEARGIEIQEGWTTKELVAALKEDDKAKKQASSPEGGFFYWIKDRSYISDTEILDAGLYHTNEKIARLHGQPAAYVEAFEGEVPDKVVYEIAKAMKVHTENFVNGKREIVDIDKVLDELVKEL